MIHVNQLSTRDKDKEEVKIIPDGVPLKSESACRSRSISALAAWGDDETVGLFRWSNRLEETFM
jgi:hypothetical protein